jgi:Flp pilus assembly protein TadD
MNTPKSELSPIEIDRVCHALFSSGRYAEALAYLDRLMTFAPAHEHAMRLAATCLDILQRGSDTNSDTSSDKRLSGDDQVMNRLGAWFYGRKQLVQAEHAFRLSLLIEPDSPQTLSNLGLVLQEQRREREAEEALRRAMALAPEFSPALINLGVLLWSLKRNEEAIALNLRALGFDPGNVQARSNLGLIQMEIGRLREAEEAFRLALSPNANVPEFQNNLGNALKQQGRVEDAITAYRHALTLNPDYMDARANLATLLLLTGDYENGWELYEARYATSGSSTFRRPNVSCPQWNGESLRGKSIMIWPEQGYGDSLQFCRYATLLKARGAAHVSIACGPALARLFSSLDHVDTVFPLTGDRAIPEHDYWTFEMSLPFHFGTTTETVPAPLRYLQAPADLSLRWGERLPQGKLKVGLVWAGDPRPHDPVSNSIDQRRSMSVLSFLPLLRVPGLTFISLQKGATTQVQIQDLPSDLRPFDPMHEVGDFADTAAIIEHLDLVITVDTSMAHLAGALGKPVWILSRYDACWRWLRDRDDSPWYPSARLFRQSEPGNWDEVIDLVEADLRALLLR